MVWNAGQDRALAGVQGFQPRPLGVDIGPGGDAGVVQAVQLGPQVLDFAAGVGGLLAILTIVVLFRDPVSFAILISLAMIPAAREWHRMVSNGRTYGAEAVITIENPKALPHLASLVADKEKTVPDVRIRRAGPVFFGGKIKKVPEAEDLIPDDSHQQTVGAVGVPPERLDNEGSV